MSEALIITRTEGDEIGPMEPNLEAIAAVRGLEKALADWLEGELPTADLPPAFQATTEIRDVTRMNSSFNSFSSGV